MLILIFKRISGDVRILSPILPVRRGLQPNGGHGSSAPNGSFECSLCDTTLETWKTARVPTYQFLSGPVRMPGMDETN
jgi:hypothetical protein